MYFNYKFIVFLCAYLRQIDLSLDRARWEDEWARLLLYYKEQGSSKYVQYFLNELTKGKDTEGFLGKVNYLFKKFFFKEGYLTKNEINSCAAALRKFDLILNSGITTYNIDIEKYRIEVATLYIELKRNLRKKDENTVMKIEHFNQYDDNVVTPMELCSCVPLCT